MTSRALADTSVFIAGETGRPLDPGALPDELAISDTTVAERWAQLRVLLRDRALRMGVNDSWIAATALALDVPVLTQDDGFPALEELQVRRA